LVFESIRKAKPKKLYLIADGPKDKKEEIKCQKTRNLIENSIDWVCEVHKIYSDTNLGCAQRIKSGLDSVFQKEQKAIILEDDTVPNSSFFKFCELCLNKYDNDQFVYHISGCNFFPNSSEASSSYHLTSIVNIWGWATWARAWNNYDLQMKSWNTQDKISFLKHWCTTKQQLKNTHAMFDLHCENTDPWTWDYQWVFTCWLNNGLSIVPCKNLVQNIGMGPQGTHTKFEKQQNPYPASLDELKFPLVHPIKKRNLEFENSYYKNTQLDFLNRIKTFIKKILNI
jgi:hypothetical protein